MEIVKANNGAQVTAPGTQAPMREVTERDVSAFLSSQPVKHSSKGYLYLKTGLLKLCTQPELRRACKIGAVHELVAAEIQVQQHLIERNIRTALSQVEPHMSVREYMFWACDQIVDLVADDRPAVVNPVPAGE